MVAKGYGDSEGEVEIKNKEEKAEQNTEKMSEAGSSSNHVNFNAIPSNGRTEKSPNDHKETQENAKVGLGSFLNFLDHYFVLTDFRVELMN